MPQKIVLTAEYSALHTDHRTIWSCDYFVIDGIDDHDVDELTYLEECPSQGVGRLSAYILRALRESLKPGTSYEFEINVDSDWPGSDRFILTYSEELREKLRVDAGDSDEDVD